MSLWISPLQRFDITMVSMSLSPVNLAPRMEFQKSECPKWSRLAVIKRKDSLDLIVSPIESTHRIIIVILNVHYIISPLSIFQSPFCLGDLFDGDGSQTRSQAVREQDLWLPNKVQILGQLNMIWLLTSP